MTLSCTPPGFPADPQIRSRKPTMFQDRGGEDRVRILGPPTRWVGPVCDPTADLGSLLTKSERPFPKVSSGGRGLDGFVLVRSNPSLPKHRTFPLKLFPPPVSPPPVSLWPIGAQPSRPWLQTVVESRTCSCLLGERKCPTGAWGGDLPGSCLHPDPLRYPEGLPPRPPLGAAAPLDPHLGSD